MKIIAPVLALLLLLGCAGVEESDRQLNHQNIGAADAIMTMAVASGDPVTALAAVLAMAEDIGRNSRTLEKNVLGKPAEPKPYTRDESKRTREKSDQDHATPWWKVALTGAGTFLLGLLTSGKLTRFLPFLAGPVGTALNLVVEGVARVREKAAANGGQIKLEGEGGLLEALTEVASKDPRAHEIIKALAHKVEERLGATL